MEVNTLDMAQYLIANSPRLDKLQDRKKRQLEKELAQNIAMYMRRLVADQQGKLPSTSEQMG